MNFYDQRIHKIDVIKTSIKENSNIDDACVVSFHTNDAFNNSDPTTTEESFIDHYFYSPYSGILQYINHDALFGFYFPDKHSKAKLTSQQIACFNSHLPSKEDEKMLYEFFEHFYSVDPQGRKTFLSVFDISYNCTTSLFKSHEEGIKYKHTFYTVKDFLMSELCDLFVSDTVIKKCKCCGRYFIPQKRTDELYCDHIHPNGKTCKSIGYEATLDKYAAKYRKRYKILNGQKMRSMYSWAQEAFDCWADTAKLMLKDVKSQKVTEEEFDQFLSKSLSDVHRDMLGLK